MLSLTRNRLSRQRQLKHRFVEHIPRELQDGVLYVSIPFKTAIHKCCCGCGNEVVTPLSPEDWSLTYDGDSISLSPSIGNWSFRCKSHYWIVRNRIRWARVWTAKEIEEVRARDREIKERHLAGKTGPEKAIRRDRKVD